MDLELIAVGIGSVLFFIIVLEIVKFFGRWRKKSLENKNNNRLDYEFLYEKIEKQGKHILDEFSSLRNSFIELGVDGLNEKVNGLDRITIKLNTWKSRVDANILSGKLTYGSQTLVNLKDSVQKDLTTLFNSVSQLQRGVYGKPEKTNFKIMKSELTKLVKETEKEVSKIYQKNISEIQTNELRLQALEKVVYSDKSVVKEATTPVEMLKEIEETKVKRAYNMGRFTEFQIHKEMFRKLEGVQYSSDLDTTDTIKRIKDIPKLPKNCYKKQRKKAYQRLWQKNRIDIN